MNTFDPTQSSLPVLSELAGRPQWVCWKWVTRADEDRPTKPPFRPDGRLASTTDASTWSTFEAVTARLDQFNGPGFVISPDDPYVGIDLDHCILSSGGLVPWSARAIALLNSYTEITPSGEGLRVWIQGRLPGNGRKKSFADGGAIEVYDRARYLTVTGRHWPGSPAIIAARQAELDTLLAECFPDALMLPRSSPAAPAAPLDLSDQELLDRAHRAANGLKFGRLWRGDTGDYGGDDSRADLALCAELYFWTRGDRPRMDRLFRQSGLMREKWDERRGERTYGDLTLDKALSLGGVVYEPSANGSSGAFTFNRTATSLPNSPAPPQVTTPTDPPVDLPAPIHNTDLGNARRLVARHGENLRSTLAHGWLIWRGTHWCEDRTRAIMRRAKATVAAIYSEAGEADSADERKALALWGLKSESAGRLAAMIELAQSEPGICLLPEQFDAHPFLLNLENGTLELTSGTLRQHRREDFITRKIPINYDATATCPRWEQFLAEITQGDEALAAYLQRAVGYSLAGDVREQCLFFLYGLGANGKGTFLEVVQRLLGEYATTAAPGLLLEQKHDQHPTAIADLTGRRVVISSEVGEGKRLAEELVKRMTGDVRLKGRKMHRDFVEFLPEYKLWIMANHKPVIKGTDEGIWRRIHTVPFTATFYDPDRALPGQPLKDPLLLTKLLAELPGILAWAVRGCLQWQQIGLARPAAVLEATQSYRQEMDILGGFLADRCVQQPTLRARSGALYAAYQAWCQASGEQAATQTAFGRALTERGFVEVRDRNLGRLRSGIGLLDEDTRDDPRLAGA
jgi:putative DNA primase/helicase